MTAPASVPPVAVLVPVKAFDQAKVRLAPALDGSERAELAQAMATNVVRAAAGLPVSVVCDDRSVADWATSVGATVIWRPGRGLNGAVVDGVAVLASSGHERVIVAHADLPHALDLAWVADFDGVTIVPDRRDDGSNVVAVPASAGFGFSYGPGSFRRHCAEAERLGLALRVEREARLGWDVDLPEDLVGPSWPAGAQRFPMSERPPS
jgi:2-phospho-L-lactate/phosphoenolpyruvate guanylyltransferase